MGQGLTVRSVHSVEGKDEQPVPHKSHLPPNIWLTEVTECHFHRVGVNGRVWLRGSWEGDVRVRDVGWGSESTFDDTLDPAAP